VHPYRPFDEKQFRHRIAARPLDLAEWIEVDDRFDEFMAEKERLLSAQHPDVFAVADVRNVGDSREASEEVLSLIQEHMQTYHPERLRPVDEGLHPLDHAGRLVQEDLCIMVERDGDHYLAAASLCFPTRWRLADKIGRSMEKIHVPVPGYQSDIGAATESMFSRLKVDKPIWRLNWSLLDDPTLFQPQGHGVPLGDLAPSQMYLRVERQTLRRLPVSGAILFTIRIHVDPLPSMVDQTDRASLAKSIELMPDPMRAYKSMAELADSTIAWLIAAP
jgi:dimethylamine monooxygenase subunit A